MPAPSVEPSPRAGPPFDPAELRLSVPLEAQDASYFAASARMASLAVMSTEVFLCFRLALDHMFDICSNQEVLQ